MMILTFHNDGTAVEPFVDVYINREKIDTLRIVGHDRRKGSLVKTLAKHLPHTGGAP